MIKSIQEMAPSGALSSITLTITLACFNSAIAEDDYLTEEDYLVDIPLVSSVSQFEQSVENSPAAVTIIDRRMIEAAGVTAIPDLLRLVPGFQVYTPSNSHPVFNYHTLPDGFPGRMEVKIDGRPAYEPLTSTVFWITQGIDVDEIEYIEVVRGSNVPANGANAINGSINIFTRSPLKSGGLRVRAETGSLDTRNFFSSYGDTVGDVSYRLSTRYGYSSGFPDYKPPNEADPLRRPRDTSEPFDVNDDSEALSVNLNMLWAPTLRDNVNIQLGLSDTNFVFDENNTGATPEELFDWDFVYSYQMIDWQHQFDSDNEIRTIFYHNRIDFDAFSDIAPLSVVFDAPAELLELLYGIRDEDYVLGTKDAVSERYDLELRHTGKLNESMKFSWGGAARLDRAKSKFYFSTYEAQSEEYYRVFGNLEYQAAKQLTYNFGVHVARNRNIGAYPSFRFSSNLHIDDHNTLRLTFNRAKRPPTVFEFNYFRVLSQDGEILIYDTIFDPEIKEEDFRGVEFGYYGNFLNGALTVDVKWFRDRNDNLVANREDEDYLQPVDVNVDPAFRTNLDLSYRTNAVYSHDTGVESQIIWRPSEAWLVMLQHTRMYIDALAKRTFDPQYDSDISDAVPEHFGSLLVDYDWGSGYSTSIAYYMQSSFDWRTSKYQDQYERFDMNLRKKIKFGDLSGRVDLIGQNLFGTDYVDFRFFNVIEPRYFLRLVVDI